MKNQNDLIVSIVAGVFALGFVAGFYFTARKPVEPTPSPKVETSPVKLPDTTVVYTNGLSGGGTAAGGGFGGPGGPPGGFGGPGGPPAGFRGGGPGGLPPSGLGSRPAGGGGAAAPKGGKDD
jgi:translation initiation factor IF-2